MAQQRQQAVADQVRGRLVPGEQEDDARRHKLVVGKPLAVGVGRGEDADQVILRVGAAVLDHRLEEGPELDQGLLETQRSGLIRVTCANEVDDVARPSHELLAPVLRRSRSFPITIAGSG